MRNIKHTILQVAQLWQRDRAKFDTFSINVRHKIGFLVHPMGASGAIYALYVNFFNKKNLVAEFHRKSVSFTRKTVN